AVTLLLGASLACTAFPAAAQTSPAPACDASSVTSPPGKTWWAENRWRYADDASATAAYQALVSGKSPWPNWYTPPLVAAPTTVLPVGTRFQMALAPGQAETSPGGWGTFDYIADVEDAREYLAVTLE